METRTRGRSLGGVVRAAARHPGRVLGGLLALLGVGSWALWAMQLRGLPDVGDPFDVAAFEAERVPDDRNAYSWYQNAAGNSRSSSGRIRPRRSPPCGSKAWNSTGRRSTPPGATS